MFEYLLIFPERANAETVADELSEDDEFAQVRVVRQALAGEDDSEDHDWVVHVLVTTLSDATSAAARALATRFDALAKDYDGWLETNDE